MTEHNMSCRAKRDICGRQDIRHDTTEEIASHRFLAHARNDTHLSLRGAAGDVGVSPPHRNLRQCRFLDAGKDIFSIKYVSLNLPKILRLGRKAGSLAFFLSTYSHFGCAEDTSSRKKCKRVCFFLSTYSHFGCAEDTSSRKKCKRVCFFLSTYSYLCPK